VLGGTRAGNARVLACRDVRAQRFNGGEYVIGRNIGEAPVVSERAAALQAVAAWNVVRQDAMRHVPGRVLRVGERVQVDDRRADRRAQMRGHRVVADDDLRRLQQCG